MATRYTDVQVAKRMREMLADSKRWCKGSLFLDEEGKATDAYHAQSYCLSGALIVATGALSDNLAIDDEGEVDGWGANTVEEEYRSQRLRVGSVLAREATNWRSQMTGGITPTTSIIGFNDSKDTTHEMVVEVLQKTVDKLTQK